MRSSLPLTGYLDRCIPDWLCVQVKSLEMERVKLTTQVETLETGLIEDQILYKKQVRFPFIFNFLLFFNF